MPKSAPSLATRDPLVLGLGAIAAITVYRLALLPLATAELFVDETQYWQWGQALDWGYYSKPPLIGWLIRAVTDLAGSDSAFWIRMPGAVLHAVTACLIIGAASELTTRAAATACGLAYLSLPFVTVGSVLISTDTVLLPFFAASTWIWLRLARGASAGLAVLLGLSIGLGIMAKYAGIYFALGAVIGAVLVPQMRIAVRDAAIAAVTALVVISPNIFWNLQNDLVTLSHTAENVDWVEQDSLSLHPARAAEFIGAQFLVFGPVFFAAYLWLCLRAWRGGEAWHRWLVAMSAPILILVIVQALLSRAYANWAVTAYIAATLLVVPVLWTRARGWFWAGLALNLTVAVALPIATTQAHVLTARDGERLLFRHYVGRVATSEAILAEARAAGLSVILSDDRGILADLFHAARDAPVSVFSVPVDGPPPHYYAQRFAYPGGEGDVLLASFAADPPCPGDLLAQWPAGAAYRGNTIHAFRLPATCWSEGE